MQLIYFHAYLRDQLIMCQIILKISFLTYLIYISQLWLSYLKEHQIVLNSSLTIPSSFCFSNVEYVFKITYGQNKHHKT